MSINLNSIIEKNRSPILTEAFVFSEAIKDPTVRSALEKAGTNIKKAQSITDQTLRDETVFIPRGLMDEASIIISPIINEMMHKFAQAGVEEMSDIAAVDIMLALLSSSDASFASRVISMARGDRSEAVCALMEADHNSFQMILDAAAEGASRTRIRRPSAAGNSRSRQKKDDTLPAELNFLTDMIEQARNYSLPFIGREDIIERTIMILARKTKHNVVHLGEPGVGKTACTIGLAKKILNGEAPDIIADARVFSLDIGALLAGTKYRGDVEQKVSSMFKYFDGLDNVILYVDEIHQIVGAGAGSDSCIDLANLFKPRLANPDSNLRVIGATTKEEYRKHIEKDKAFARRFQTIDVLEPSISDATKIIMGLKGAFEEYHHVTFTKDAIKAAVELSAKYINDRYLPDKAIDVIDETAARLSIAGKKKVSKIDVQDTVSKIAKIPSENVTETDSSKLSKLTASIKENVFGQDTAADDVAAAVRMSKAGLNEDNKPIASFLFVGPTGVGKTEIAKTLANTMGIPLVRFDMSEYKDETSVTKFVGASAGYVGYEDGSLLVNAIKDKPHCVLLLDEIEKAHPAVFDVLLQVMDNATLTDNKGRVADFKNVVIIMTSNAGARDMTKKSIGFEQNSTVNVAAIDDAVKATFAPEFRNRLTKVVKFNNLDKDMARNVARKQLKILAAKLSAKNVKLTYDDEVLDKIIADGNYTEYGGREIVRIVDNDIKPLFVDLILDGALANGGTANIIVNGDKFDVVAAAKKASKKKEPVTA